MLLLYERYFMSGNNDHGYFMLHRAAEMAEALGIINGPRLNLNQSNMSENMISSIKRTAWGLFQINTVVHANFLLPCRVLEVSVGQIDRNKTDETELWVSYQINKEARRSWMSQYFDEACKLSTITRDISCIFLPDQEPGVGKYEHKRVLYDKLRQWEQELPEGFVLAEWPASHIILLRPRYHTLLINLFFDFFGGNPPFYFLSLTSPFSIVAPSLERIFYVSSVNQ